MKLVQELMKKEKLVALLLVGMLLLIVALPVKEKEKNQEERRLPSEEEVIEGEEELWQNKMEKRLRQVLEQVEGIGETQVLSHVPERRKRWWKRMKQKLCTKKMPEEISLPM